MDSNINDEYRRILSDMDANMKNADDLEYAKTKMNELCMLFVDELQTVSDKNEDRTNALAQKQQELEDTIKKMRKDVNEIMKDIYDEDELDGNEVFEFEITCPYCNYSFETEVDENKKEVKCPECENLIELDWDGLEEDGYCGGSCEHCHSCDDDCDCDDCDCDDNDEDM